MKNHELLDMIGDVNEDYVRAADSDVTRPQFRWKTWAAIAACAALVLCAYPIWKPAQPRDLPLNEKIPLHAYTTVAGGAGPTADSQEDLASAYDPQNGSLEVAGAAPAAGSYTPEPAPDITYIDQDNAIMQHERLDQNCHLDDPPEWYAGSWLDNDYSDRAARFTVSIVEGFHTPELEAQIVEWCGGGEVVFAADGKYSYAHLRELQEQIFQELSDPGKEAEWAGWTSMGTDVWANCLNIDFSGAPSDEALAFLAQLDPDGDAIHVWAYTGRAVTADADDVKGPAPDVVSTPVPGGARAEPSIEEQDFPAESPMPAYTENAQPAQYDTLPGPIDELPQAKYDVIYGADE